MFLRSRSSRLGLTFPEILVVVAIMAILLTIVGTAFSASIAQQELKRGAGLVRSVLEDARSRTLASRAGSDYGVHFNSTSTTLFIGSTYSASDPTNEIAYMPERTNISSITLTGGGSDVVFKRLTGATAEDGTITVALDANPADTKTVTIQSTGLIILQ